MIQLQYSSTTGSLQNKTIWSDSSITASLLQLDLTSSFSGPYKSITSDIVSNTTNNINGGWILFSFSSSQSPTASGYYEGNIYAVETGIAVKWNTANEAWNTVAQKWNNYKLTLKGDFITQERVFVSGSDYEPEYTYEFDEMGYYTVYNG